MKTCWVVTNGYAGIINQALGLAEHLPVHIVHKKVTLRPFWYVLSPYITLGKKFCMTKESDTLTPPWPELVIASGRQAILPALYIKEASKGFTKIIYLQDPILKRKAFDAVICPAHDDVTGDNVITMVGTTHRVTQDVIDRESEKFRDVFEIYPSPRVSVLIGGPNKTFLMNDDFGNKLAAQLQDLQKRYGCSLLITTSRRTPPHVIKALQAHLPDKTYIHNAHHAGGLSSSKGDNPYFALLGWGDYILLTCDSVCMISEVAATTKPVYLLPLQGGNAKFNRFHDNILNTGRVQWFDGNLHDRMVFEPFNENVVIAKTLQNILGI